MKAPHTPLPPGTKVRFAKPLDDHERSAEEGAMSPARRQLVLGVLGAAWVMALWLWLYFGPLNY